MEVAKGEGGGAVKHILDHIRRLVPLPTDGDGDAQLLARFVAANDQEAFATLVRRHGGMVLGVCRRVLRNSHDAEDAFQAAFFVLARRAGSVARREALTGWLYGVACRTALEARRRRQGRERPMHQLPHPEVAPAEAQDWRPVLDEELDRLPEKYRSAVVLADLQGRTRKEVARLLRVPEGTVSSRLATARRMLAARLSRRGVTLPGGLLGTALVVERASASVSVALAAATAKAAVRFVEGQTAALASPAAALTKGVFQAMLVKKLKVVVASVMVAAALGACGLGACYTAAVQARPAAEGKDDLEALRKENDLLRRSLELALDKVRAQDAELKELRKGRDQALYERTLRLSQFDRLGKLTRMEMTDPELEALWKLSLLGIETDPAADIEAALKALREAKDKDAMKKAAEALERAIKKFKDRLR
jgi:RNA polymerase sigma factor (sigma-70 family)